MKKTLLLVALTPLLMPNVALAAAPVNPGQPAERIAVEEPPLRWPDYTLAVSPAGWEETKIEPPEQPAPPKQSIVKVPRRDGITLTVAKKPGRKNFPRGQCTWWVSTKRPVVWRGNANQWPRAALAEGFKTGRTPIQGAILVTNENRRYGHVAYLESVHSDGSFTFSESNYRGVGVITRRTFKPNDRRIVTFIY